MVNFGNDWDKVLAGEFEKEYYLKLREFLINEYKNQEVYPPMGDIFNALKYSAYDETKVVILGQDPYHQPGQAHGLCFSVNKGVKIPPSLVNIYKEMKEEGAKETFNKVNNKAFENEDVLFISKEMPTNKTLLDRFNAVSNTEELFKSVSSL